MGSRRCGAMYYSLAQRNVLHLPGAIRRDYDKARCPLRHVGRKGAQSQVLPVLREALGYLSSRRLAL